MKVQEYPDLESAQEHVVSRIAARLQDDISSRGYAVLVLTGGSTIRPFLVALSDADLDWRHVIVVLSDERWVPIDNDMSNEKQLRELFLGRLSPSPRYISLKSDAVTPHDGISSVADVLKPLLPVTAALLSIGDDGHVASLFPDEPGVWLDNTDIAVATDARGGRISLGVPVLHHAGDIILLLKKPRMLDAEKRNYLQKIFSQDAHVVSF